MAKSLGEEAILLLSPCPLLSPSLLTSVPCEIPSQLLFNSLLPAHCYPSPIFLPSPFPALPTPLPLHLHSTPLTALHFSPPCPLLSLLSPSLLWSTSYTLTSTYISLFPMLLSISLSLYHPPISPSSLCCSLFPYLSTIHLHLPLPDCRKCKIFP